MELIGEHRNIKRDLNIEMESNTKELRFTYYTTFDGIDYVTLCHVPTEICLGSNAVIRENINSYTKEIQLELIKKDTKAKLLQQMELLDRKLNVK